MDFHLSGVIILGNLNYLILEANIIKLIPSSYYNLNNVKKLDPKVKKKKAKTKEKEKEKTKAKNKEKSKPKSKPIKGKEVSSTKKCKECLFWGRKRHPVDSLCPGSLK